MRVRCTNCWGQYDDVLDAHVCQTRKSGTSRLVVQNGVMKTLLKPASCVNCASKDQEIESLEAALAEARRQLDSYQRQRDDEILLVAQLKQENALLTVQLAEAQNAIARANNSLYGSDNFFLSLNGGEANEYHLAEGIENLKALCNQEGQRLERAEALLGRATWYPLGAVLARDIAEYFRDKEQK